MGVVKFTYYKMNSLGSNLPHPISLQSLSSLKPILPVAHAKYLWNHPLTSSFYLSVTSFGFTFKTYPEFSHLSPPLFFFLNLSSPSLHYYSLKLMLKPSYRLPSICHGPSHSVLIPTVRMLLIRYKSDQIILLLMSLQRLPISFHVQAKSLETIWPSVNASGLTCYNISLSHFI